MLQYNQIYDQDSNYVIFILKNGEIYQNNKKRIKVGNIMVVNNIV